MKTEQFEVGYSIYQVADGSFRVWKLDENGKRTKQVKGEYEFYANAVCALIKELTK
jgi:hypothetical protein